MNLERLAEKTQSSLVFAHVRASTSGALAEINCHPWSYHSLMWMHNGTLSQRLRGGIDEQGRSEGLRGLNAI